MLKPKLEKLTEQHQDLEKKLAEDKEVLAHVLKKIENSKK